MRFGQPGAVVLARKQILGRVRAENNLPTQLDSIFLQL